MMNPEGPSGSAGPSSSSGNGNGAPGVTISGAPATGFPAPSYGSSGATAGSSSYLSATPAAGQPYAAQINHAAAGQTPSGEPLTASSSEQLFAATRAYERRFQAFLDSTVPYSTKRWGFTAGALVVFMLRIVLSHGWYIVCYGLFIYLLNLFLAFLTPKFDPSLDDDLAAQDVEEGEPGLPTSAGASKGGLFGGRGGSSNGGGGLMSGVFGGPQPEDEFRPFIRRLPEFKFWLSATQAVLIAIFCTFFEFLDVPVVWQILVLYFIILFALTMRRQIEHMIKYKYVPFDLGRKATYGGGNRR